MNNLAAMKNSLDGDVMYSKLDAGVFALFTFLEVVIE